MSAKSLPTKTFQPPELKVLIICEDLESGKHAKEVQDQLHHSLDSRVALAAEAWTFRALQDPELELLARREIRQADLILFSTRGDAEVPGAIKTWLETRLAEEGGPRGLVALFGAKTPNHWHSTRQYLE